MNIYGLFRERASRDPERLALSFGQITWTFGQVLQIIDQVATKLRTSGVKVGDRIVYVSENDPKFFFMSFACFKLGAVFVPLNFRLSTHEIMEIIGEMAPAGVAVGGRHRDSIEADIGENVFIWDLGDLLEEDGLIPGNMDSTTPYAAVDAAETPAIILFTSGTTGRPRGIELTHANLWFSMLNVSLCGDFQRDDCILLMAPLSAVATWPWMLGAWVKGGSVSLLPAVDPDLFLSVIPARKVSIMAPVVALLEEVSRMSTFDQTDLSSLRWIVCGGAPLSDELRARFTQRGIEVYLSYGMTETTGMVALVPRELAESKSHAAGQPLLLTEVRIVDEANVDVQVGDVGEILLRGPNITKTVYTSGIPSFVRDPEGWFHTGDLGSFDEAGILSIAGRSKEMIKSGGENVYPAEVERVLSVIPAIEEVAIVGAPHPRWGETVVAFVVTRDGSPISLDELRNIGGRSLARYKLPTRVEFRDSLPKSSTGKIQKHVLRNSLENV